MVGLRCDCPTLLSDLIKLSPCACLSRFRAFAFVHEPSYSLHLPVTHMRTVRSLSVVIVLAGCCAALAAEPKVEVTKAPAEAVARWRPLKFGMFIHWGPCSLKGTTIGWSRGTDVPIAEYDNLYKRFNPVRFDGTQWAKIAKDAGMRYIVLVTKHHDGFCLFDTKQTDYNIMHSPFGRDVTKELAAAARKAGLAFGTYYSVPDWHNPDFAFTGPMGKTPNPRANMQRYEQFLCKQMEELIGNYGPLLTIWFDDADPANVNLGPVRAAQVVKYIRSLQPDILINARSGCRAVADYTNSEQVVGEMQTGLPWETCMTLCGPQWSWTKPNEPMKSLKECLHILVNTVGGDGNLLLNVGPMPDGRIEPRQAERLAEIGRWLTKYGESIYGTRGGPFPRGPWGAATCKDNTVYVHVLDPKLDVVKLPPLGKKIVGSKLLTGGTAQVKQTDKGTEISVPPTDRQPIDTIVVLTLAP
jgi:alpha-L-fucosidase